MRIRTGFMVAAALTLPLASVVLLEGTAVAKKVTGTGTPACAVGGTITFNPPLTKNGTAGVKKEVITLASTLSGCTGGTPVPPSTAVSAKPIKNKVTKGTNAGTCTSFAGSAGTTVVKAKIKWAGEKPSKFTINGLHVAVNGMGEAGFTASVPVTGSYAGTGSLAVYLTVADSNAIGACTGSITTVHIDQSQSTTTL